MMTEKIRLIISAVVCVVAFAAGWVLNGWRLSGEIESKKREWAEQETSRVAAALDRQKEQLANNVRIEYVYEKGEDVIRTEFKTITKEIIKYVQSPDAGKCTLPARWVRIHDDAATGLSPSSTAIGLVDEAGPTATDAEALPVVANNYETYREVANQLTGLQAYVAENCIK